jgi:redox-sensitive bicupin YhaK (pirin superfamily)
MRARGRAGIHRTDTTGTHALVRPGQLNLMTAGSGIAHSEYSTPTTTVLHGAQLWIALPRVREGQIEILAPRLVRKK